MFTCCDEKTYYSQETKDVCQNRNDSDIEQKTDSTESVLIGLRASKFFTISKDV